MKALAEIYKSGLLLVCLLLWQPSCDSDHRMPAKIYIPEGYVGWVRIEYGVSGAPEQESHLFEHTEYQRFPPSGLIQTTTELKNGAASAEYFFYRGRYSKRLSEKMIHGGTISWCVRRPDDSRLGREFITFFVGSKGEYERHKHELEKFKVGDCRYVVNSIEDLPKVGNLNQGRA